jgi:hypothetical protein
MEFDTPAGGRISVLGLRFTPPNNALTTIPALANVSAGGGSIAHLASGGDGWQTSFVLVNTGTSADRSRSAFLPIKPVLLYRCRFRFRSPVGVLIPWLLRIRNYFRPGRACIS